MKPTSILLAVAGAALVGACGGKSETEAMTEMTAEEHARMAAGGAGPTDSAGAALREAVHLTAAQAQAIGVTYTTVTRGPLARTVRTVGQFVPAEPGLAEVTTKIDGFIEELYVDATGVPVRKGQPLLALYSPMLVAAQEELLTALRLVAAVDSGSEAAQSAMALVAAARRRLVYWDISPAQIERLERTGHVTKTLTLAAPSDGYVLEKMVVAGQAVMPGMALYRLANLSVVWVEGEVFERDLALVRVGTRARAEVTAYPGRTFAGRVSFVWPIVDPISRAAKVRVAFGNRERALKPGMYATLFFEGVIGGDVLHVPAEAVVMTGERNLVFVVQSNGMLAPREVTLGSRAGDRYQVLAGVAEGERVVASANFLVDAESRLAGGGAMAGMPGMPDMPGSTGDTGSRP
jgi:Cu(I)/Ag(I) efflux system membrane fusion protein